MSGKQIVGIIAVIVFIIGLIVCIYGLFSLEKNSALFYEGLAIAIISGIIAVKLNA